MILNLNNKEGSRCMVFIPEKHLDKLEMLLIKLDHLRVKNKAYLLGETLVSELRTVERLCSVQPINKDTDTQTSVHLRYGNNVKNQIVPVIKRKDVASQTSF